MKIAFCLPIIKNRKIEVMKIIQKNIHGFPYFEVKSKNLKCIVLGMGKFGVITRIFGTLWGNELTFAPEILTEKSAEGQLTKRQLQTIFKELKK